MTVDEEYDGDGHDDDYDDYDDDNGWLSWRRRVALWSFFLLFFLVFNHYNRTLCQLEHDNNDDDDDDIDGDFVNDVARDGEHYDVGAIVLTMMLTYF
jgi:hypothetical protein